MLDVSDAIGAYCTRLLAGLGADVIKVEYPEGDELRRRPPFRDGSVGPEASLVFAYYHAGKRGITLDTRREESVPILRELGATADVVVISPSRRRPLAGFDEDAPRRVVGDGRRGDLFGDAVRAYGSVSPPPGHSLRRLRDQRRDAQGRSTRGSAR